MSTWIWLAIAAALGLFGLVVTVAGLVVVVKVWSARRAPRAAAARATSPPPRKAPVPAVVPAGLAPTALAAGAPPTDQPWEDDDVPTGVFRPTDFNDLDALMAQAEQYVDKHKRR